MVHKDGNRQKDTLTLRLVRVVERQGSGTSVHLLPGMPGQVRPPFHRQLPWLLVARAH